MTIRLKRSSSDLIHKLEFVTPLGRTASLFALRMVDGRRYLVLHSDYYLFPWNTLCDPLRSRRPVYRLATTHYHRS